MSEKVVIGLEVHCQLTSLKTKLFCSCPSNYRGREPNTLVCPTCLGLPGSLPVLNQKALEYGLMVALALNCKIPKRTMFFRKNYFYPDMAKNFQISMFDRAGGAPLGYDGYVTLAVGGTQKLVRIRRVHLEEDPGRLVYPGTIDTAPYTLVDYNRHGVALVEVVTEPDFESPKEARAFLQKLRSILEHLGVFDGGLEGAMRCDANISIAGGARVEVKNIGSFKDVERALTFEIMRQKQLLAKKVAVVRETRHWDGERRITVSLRTKEEEYDYRYFPEPDLVPVEITEEMLDQIKARLPELPDARQKRFVSQYGLPGYDAMVLTSDKALADFFEKAVAAYGKPKVVSNWLMSDVLRCLNEYNLEIWESKLTPEHLVEMLKLIDEGVISGKIAKNILWDMVSSGKSPKQIVEERGLTRIADEEYLRKLVDEVFKENPKAVEDALSDEKAIHFLVGQLMKKTRGRADPQLANKIIREKLASK